jgi:hypothetical protein
VRPLVDVQPHHAARAEHEGRGACTLGSEGEGRVDRVDAGGSSEQERSIHRSEARRDRLDNRNFRVVARDVDSGVARSGEQKAAHRPEPLGPLLGAVLRG